MNPEEIHYQRESYKIGLENYTIDLNRNHFDESINKVIQDYQNELNKEIRNFEDLQNENPNEYYYLDIEYLENKLLALSEMNVVYAYKDFEINLKKLISASYGIKSKEFYKWDNVLNFLKSKGIKYKNIEGYQEVNELRLVNNYIKHSNSLIDDNLKKINEFSDIKYMEHICLINFFERTKNSTYIFLSNLSDEFYKDLYEFSDERLNHIAQLFALRMDKSTSKKFINFFESKY